jgi:hypothetical protein
VRGALSREGVEEERERGARLTHQPDVQKTFPINKANDHTQSSSMNASHDSSAGATAQDIHN